MTATSDLRRLEVLAKQYFLLLGHLHGNVEALDPVACHRLLALEPLHRLLLPGGLPFALLEIALQLRDPEPARLGVASRGLRARLDLARLLGLSCEVGGDGRPLFLRLLKLVPAVFELLAGLLELAGDLLALLPLVLERDAHEVDKIVGGAGAFTLLLRLRLHIGTVALGLDLLPPRQREEREQEKVTENE
jgi:hypothetical protein